ncbi:MAG: excinuclease ABC subunit UvrC [Legionella sp.]
MDDSPPIFDLSHFLAHLTTEPGVYRMLDDNGVVLYVGKASNLKNRVSSYFHKNHTGAKTRSLVGQVAAIEVSITRSETEALLLESSLIKSLRPKYNVLLRDDKSYPYLYVSSHPKFPRMEIMRSKKKPHKGEFYGPYPSATAVRQTLITIQKVFKIRSCTDSYFSARSRPCLQFQIKRCSAPCTNHISTSDYRQSLHDATRFLQGKCQAILDDLAERMDDAVAILDFEQAAALRDQIKSLRLIQEQQGMIQVSGDADVIAIEFSQGIACIQCVSIRNGEVLASQSFFPSLPCVDVEQQQTEEQLWQQVFAAFVAYYYIDAPQRIPALIICNHSIEDRDLLETTLGQLRGKACKIQIKPRGVKARWYDFAQNNLQMTIAEHSLANARSNNRYQALAKLLDLPTDNTRIECFDISHTQGESTVASCVVFDDKGPCKREYRRFVIDDITPGDDYAAMKQAITRRFKRLLDEQRLPALLIIDGGKGQLGIARQVFAHLKVEGVRLLAIAKGPTRKAGWEKLILADRTHEITLLPHDPALHLLQHIRDEAHRFAITLHRKKRQKAGLGSSLEHIEGIGVKRRQALLKRFGGLRELAKAPLEEITKVSGINASLARRIYSYFHP